MKDGVDLRQLLLAYKLGQLSKEEREQFDERIVGDRDYSDRVAEAEYDLLDDFRAGRLTRRQSRRVKKAFSAAELRRAAVHGFNPPGPAEPVKRADLLRWPLAVALLACLSTGLLMFYGYLRNAGTPAPVASSSPQASHEPQDGSGSPVSPAGAPAALSAQRAGDSLAVLLLQPVVTRSGTAAVLELKPATKMIRVQWVIPDAVGARVFSLSVTREGNVLTTIAQLHPPRRIDGALVAEFDLPSSLFAGATGGSRYLFVVSSGNAQRNAEGEYPVIVQARP